MYICTHTHKHEFLCTSVHPMPLSTLSLGSLSSLFSSITELSAFGSTGWIHIHIRGRAGEGADKGGQTFGQGKLWKDMLGCRRAR